MAKPSSSKTIEVTVISAEGLLLNKKQPVKKPVSVTVKTDPFNSGSTGHANPGSPSWNEKIIMELPGHARFMAVEVHSGSRVIGAANIPVTDFAGGHLPDNYLSFLSYRLRDGYGEKNGIVNLSVKVGGTAGKCGGAARLEQPWMAAPGVGTAVDGGIVTGIPVFSYGY